MRVTKIILSVALASTLSFALESASVQQIDIDAQIETIQNTPESERVEAMNAFKQEVANMNVGEQEAIIAQVQDKMHASHNSDTQQHSQSEMTHNSSENMAGHTQMMHNQENQEMMHNQGHQENQEMMHTMEQNHQVDSQEAMHQNEQMSEYTNVEHQSSH